MSLLGMSSPSQMQRLKIANGVDAFREMPSIPDSAIGQSDIGVIIDQIDKEKRKAVTDLMPSTMQRAMPLTPFASAWSLPTR